jgi:large subunit ribosomal protein L35
MPKMKTNRGAAKRFKFTATGKVKVNKSRRRHILEKKTTKMKRQLRKGGLAAASDVPRIRRLCPYG